MAAEIVPNSVAADGNLRITFVPALANPKSVAILNGGTAKDITYSLTPAGFTRTITENSIEDGRLTLKQVLTRAGTTTQSVEVQYVWGDAGDVAKVTLTEGVAGFLVLRYAVPNATAWTVGQKVDVIPITAGRQRKDAPTANGLLTVTQGIYVSGTTEDDVALVA
jgi:hypothetical protein